MLTGIKALAALFGVIPSYYGTESDIPYSGLSVFSSVMFAIIVIYYGGAIYAQRNCLYQGIQVYEQQ